MHLTTSPRRRTLTTALGAALALLAACSSGRPQTPPPPPTVTFEAPIDGSYLHGVITVQARATGSVKIASFTFTAPAALAGTTAVLDPVNHAATLSAQLDLASIPDGPLKLTVSARDELGGTTTKDLSVNVAATAPTINVGSPSSGGTVKGSALGVTATATAQNGATITRLELLNPPLGMGPNTSAAAALFTALWDTTAAPEGPVALHFRATDSTGLVGDTVVNVTVDNVPAGKVDAFVFAGAPVAAATVEVWALSNTTGAVDLTAGANGLLGAAGPTDDNGHILVTLSAENYSGPIQLRAKPAAGSTLQYVDPSDPSNGFVQIASTLTLTNIIPAYTTGQAVTAPITLTTTLADAELLAYAAGLHRLHPTTSTLAAAAAYGDGLFTQHVQTSTPRWNLRTTVPVDLAAGPTTLTDRAYAAFMDVALNQLGKDLGTQVHVSGVITAPFLVNKLIVDLSADGQLDGKGQGGTVITTQTGSPPYTFDENTLRVRLANALDTWIQSARNQSSLNRSTLSGANIYNAISEDTSELFGPGAPSAFDNAAPAVTAVITYGATTQPPYAGTFVSGATKVVATITDPSGVKSVSVKLGNQVLDSAATVLTSADGLTTTYTATINTASLADMSYTLNVTAVDQRNNSATTTVATVTTDNTPPTVTQVQPAAATYYSATAQFDATASDGAGAGVASLTVSGYAGLVDGDATAEHFLGTWSIPAPTADGSAAGTWTTCDHVGNCASPAVSARVDRTAPAITIQGSPPAYVATPTVTLTVTASDVGAGVGTVYAQVPGTTIVTGTLSGGVWTLKDVPLFVGSNPVQVWGTDLATPANGSPLTSTVVNVTRASTPPTPRLTAKKSYIDERGAALASAAVPPVYTLASSTPVALSAVTDIYKLSTRLTSPGLTPAVLEGANPDNIPYLQIQVPFGVGTAAVQSASYAVSVKAASTAAQLYTGALLPWKSPASNASADLYDLPLTADLFPELASGYGPLTVTVDVTVTDKAGQEGALPTAQYTFHALGAPLFIAEDTAWPAYLDPRSTYAYKLATDPAAGSGYKSLFDTAGSAFFNGQVRLVRYVIQNPTTSPVALSPALTSSTWSMAEAWPRFRGAVRSTNYTSNSISAPVAYVVDGFTFYDAQWWDNPATQYGLPTKFESATAWPCAGVPMNDTVGTRRAAHVFGDTTNKWSCIDEAITPVDSTSVAAGALDVFGPAQQQGGEVVAPATIGGNQYVVPAASGGTPGSIVVYVTRPVAVPHAHPLTWNALTTSSRYEYQESWLMVYDHQYGSAFLNYDGFIYRTTKGGRYLSAATETLSGSIQFTTRPIFSNALAGEASAAPALDLTRTVSTH